MCLVSLEPARLTTLLELDSSMVGNRCLGHREGDSAVNGQGVKRWHNWLAHRVDVAYVDGWGNGNPIDCCVDVLVIANGR